MLIDAFPYAYGSEVLLLRMQELSGVVDVHVIVEASVTHTGRRREWSWPVLQNAPEFAPYRNKVAWCPIDIPNGIRAPWGREEYIRSACLLHAKALAQGGKDLILFSDHDEIPHPDALMYVVLNCVERARLLGTYHEWYLNLRAVGSPFYLWEFRQPMTFRADDHLISHWGDEAGARLRAMQWLGADALEFGGRNDPEYRGWHMTLQGGERQVWGKLQTCAHTELQSLSLQNIKAMMWKRLDILERCRLEKCSDLDLPASLIANRGYYERMMLA